MKDATNNGFKQTDIGTIPNEWDVARLMDVCVKAEQRNPQSEPEKKFLYVDVSSISNQTFRIVSSTPTLGKDASSRARKAMKENDVLIATIRPSLKRIAVVPKELDGQICSTAFCVVRAKDGMASPHFLFNMLLTDNLTDRISELERGSSYPAVTDNNILSQFIPLPPLPEQRTISAILSKIQQAIEVQEKIIERTKELKKSLMAKLFTEGLYGEELKETEIGLMPKSWEVVDLGSCTTQTQYGLSVRGNPTGKYPILRMNCLVRGKVTTEKLQWVDISEKEFRAFSLTKGDILFNRTNSSDLVGKTSIFDLKGDFVFASYLIRVRVQVERMNPLFLNYYINLDTTQSRLRGLAQRGVSQSNISASKLRTLLVPIPDLLEQKNIADILDIVDNKISIGERRRDGLEHLFKSMLHQLMTGTIRVNSIELQETLQ